MEYYIAYHSNSRFMDGRHGGETRIERAGMTVSGENVYSNAQGMALCCGRLRNGYQLSHELGVADGSAAQLALLAYARWGDDYARHLQGPLLSCICDTQRDRMLVSRDRMGEVSAFYARRGSEAALSDHPEALLSAGIAEPVIDRDGLCELLGLGPACTPGKTPLTERPCLMQSFIARQISFRYSNTSGSSKTSTYCQSLRLFSSQNVFISANEEWG